MKKYKHSSEHSTKGKKAKIKKRIATVMVVNMLSMAVLPAAVFGASIPVASATTTNTDTAATTAKVPSPDTLNLNVRSAVLIEPTTGEVLLSINADEAYAPASMTKMMTEYIVADKVKKGELSWDTEVTVQKNAASSVGSRIYLAEGDTHSVEELYIAMAVGSANDATVALAEYVAGSEQEFVKMMNEEAKRMGLTKTHFINSTGLDRADMPEEFRPEEDRETLMSAMDAAILAKYIITDHPDFANYTAIPSYKFRETDADPMVNWNWMLEANKGVTNFKQFAYEGLDGLKTGHTKSAGNCFAGTAERDGMRLISVVMGAETNASRFTETKKVLDYGFENFEVKQVVAAKSAVPGAETAPVVKGKETEAPVVTEQAVNFLVPKGTENPTPTFETSFEGEGLTAPVEAGTKAGTITYTYKIEGMASEQVQTVNLVTSEPVDKAGWFSLMFRAIGDFFGDMFDSIKNLF
ncbi:D-alanyl-D-alanine carboxypeptidase family protein [Paenibacillus provencensis]|uniref:serine-type D-Ala-D-Ala carboxypeptidase n=1 Tax=Paenibacillus provencensis TaxID=441151 RepID=A0ABW3PZS2_9BACL|nr:D-alanyl-D-alanine carboxypeptidase family protein [Paenibacillus sp. MER 78]MCM3130922.1 D-alanyl-D-alanine carboxypeptidase [Paenibacillus sp. MER 78]